MTVSQWHDIVMITWLCHDDMECFFGNYYKIQLVSYYTYISSYDILLVQRIREEGKLSW